MQTLLYVLMLPLWLDRIELQPGASHKVVRDFLVHFGYGNTLAAFDSAAGNIGGGSEPHENGGVQTANGDALVAFENGADPMCAIFGCMAFATLLVLRGGHVFQVHRRECVLRGFRLCIPKSGGSYEAQEPPDLWQHPRRNGSS